MVTVAKNIKFITIIVLKNKNNTGFVSGIKFYFKTVNKI